MGLPINPVLNGLLRAYSVGTMLRQQAMQQRQQAMAEQRQQREMEMGDVRARMMLSEAGATPVTEGMVQDEVPLSSVPGMVGEGAVPVTRKAQSVVRVGDQQFELPAPELQAQRGADKLREEWRIRRESATQQAADTQAMTEQSQQRAREMFGLPITEEMSAAFGVPAGTKVMPSEFQQLAGRMLEHQRLSKPPEPMAGRDVPLPDAVEAQRTRMSAAVPRPGVDVPLPPEVEAQRLRMSTAGAGEGGGAKTSDQKNYQMAKSEGFTGTFLDWMRERNPRPSIGTERQALAFFNRAKGALDTLTTPGAEGKSLEERMAESNLARQGQLQYAPNLLQSREQQAYRQAQRAFTEARLRKESGAAIAAHEFENDSKMYFAQPGDSPETIEQKRKARQTVVNGLAFTSGKAYEEYYGEPAPRPGRDKATAPAATAGPKEGDTATGQGGKKIVLRGGKWVPL